MKANYNMYLTDNISYLFSVHNKKYIMLVDYCTNIIKNTIVCAY